MIRPLAAVAVAGGAVRPLEDGAVEGKRLIVRNGQRVRGFGRAMRAALSRTWQRGEAYRTIPLETGARASQKR